METSRCEYQGLYSLPNELLMQVLSLFPSRSLLLLTAVSCRFRDLATRIIHDRLKLAASLQDHKLILECYHPSNRFTEPYLFCEYLGTIEFSNDMGSRSKVRDGDDCSNTLTIMYSRFKPVRADADTEPARRYPATINPGDHSAVDLSGRASVALSEDIDGETVTRTVNMDPHELFSQLCISVVLVQVGPRRGIFLSCVDILQKKTARIWRQWLLENSIDSEGEHERMIWADQGRNVGLKLRIREKKTKQHAPILQHKDENQAISYDLDLEDVLIRSAHILFGIEQSILETSSKSSTAMIFASFGAA